MFDDRSSGREFASEVHSDPAGSDVVQSLRLKPAPFNGGSWCIPAIHASIPAEISASETTLPRNSAAFALTAHAEGMALPEGEFTSIKATIEEQLEQYVREQIGDVDDISMLMSLAASESLMTLTVEPTSYINTFAIGPTVVKLNAFDPGLGWFVFDTIQSLGGAIPVYGIQDVADFVGQIWYDASSTDEEVVEQYREEFGEPDITTDEFFERMGGIKPSDLVESVDGQKWMLSHTQYDSKKKVWKAVKRPRAMSAKRVERLVREGLPEELQAVVSAALAFRRGRKSGEFEPIQTQSDREHGGCDEYRGVYGASCIVVWDKPRIAWEVITHYEEYEMNGDGDQVRTLLFADPTNSEEVKSLVNSFKAIVRCHAATNNLLKHFPILTGN